MTASHLLPSGLEFLDPRQGLAGWAEGFSNCPLPAELANHVPVTVKDRVENDLLVEDGTGQQWLLQRYQVDCGRIYKINGHWLPESDPRVLAALEAMLTPSGKGEPSYPEELATIGKVLERNGRRERHGVLSGGNPIRSYWPIHRSQAASITKPQPRTCSRS